MKINIRFNTRISYNLIQTSIPSSTSTVVSNEDDDSIDNTPSGPTLSIASAIMVPIISSFPAEIDAMATNKIRILVLEDELT